MNWEEVYYKILANLACFAVFIILVWGFIIYIKIRESKNKQ